MISGRELEQRGGSELKIDPQGADVVFKWLKAVKSVSEAPVPVRDEQNELNLSAFEIHNSILQTVVSNVYFVPGESYQIMTGFIPNEQDSIGGLLGVLSGPRRYVDQSSGEPLPDIRKLKDTLSRKLSVKGVGVNLEKDQTDDDAIRIVDTSGRSYSLGLKMGRFGNNIYLLELKDKIGEQKEFEDAYREYALLIGDVANSIYHAKRETPPDRTITFAPPEDTASKTKRLETILGMVKQTLGVSGMMDDELEKEIEGKIVYERPTEAFDDIGGQDRAKDELKTLAFSLVHPEAFEEEGTYPPRRVLLYGPPGTGKTTLARALAHEAQAGIFVVELADVVHALYGRSERYVQKLFEVARRKTPVILFFDELDALATQRQSSDQVISRIVNVLLTNLDGMNARDERLMVVGTTNRLDAIDRALLRPGRFDSLIELKLPNDKDRATILGIHMRRAIERAGGKQLFDPSLDTDAFVSRTEGFSGDDIRELIKRALNVRVRRKLQGLELHPITTEDLLSQVVLYESIRIEKQKRLGFQQP